MNSCARVPVVWLVTAHASLRLADDAGERRAVTGWRVGGGVSRCGRAPDRRGDVQHFAWERLALLGDTFGHRLSGSPSLNEAIQWAVGR